MGCLPLTETFLTERYAGRFCSLRLVEFCHLYRAGGAIIAALGIFNSKKWGAIMAIIVAASLVGQRCIRPLSGFWLAGIVVSVLKVLLAVAVIILLVLHLRARYTSFQSLRKLMTTMTMTKTKRQIRFLKKRLRLFLLADLREEKMTPH